MKIKVLPHILALHLKRFKLLPAEDKYVKLAYRVAFPLELRLFNTVDDAEDPDRLYKLFSIVVHIGGCVLVFLSYKEKLADDWYLQGPASRALHNDRQVIRIHLACLRRHERHHHPRE